MPFSEKDITKIAADIEEIIWSKRRPPLSLRDQIREGQRIEGSTVDIFMNRPKWDDPTVWQEEPIARVRYVESKGIWKLYWKRADLKWHAYPEMPNAPTLREALNEIQADPSHCFWG